MKHISSFEDFLAESNSLNEGITYHDAHDANLSDLTSYVKGCQNIHNDAEKIEFVKDWLKKVKPVSLTGRIRTDAPVFIAYLAKTFKHYGIDLDTRNITISSDNFSNEIEIGVTSKTNGDGEVTFNTYLDYDEIAYGADGVIGGNFSLDGALLDDSDPISDLSDGREIAQAAGLLNQWLKTHNYI